ncbi:MAG: hypothetical protein ACJ71E_04880 [Nitrososphaeraceae archaeon]|jgi:hypothetical protein
MHMTVLLDSYMGMFLPRDIAVRITNFMAGDIVFPFIDKNEITATFYLFGKDKGVIGHREAQTAIELARMTIQKSSRYITILRNMHNKLSPDFIRQDYTKRALQISIEVQNEPSFDLSHLNRRISTDPTILSACFTQHIAYYNQDYFFELLGPFNESEVPKDLLNKLQARMLLLGYNTEDAQSLPFQNRFFPFLDWIRMYG